MVHIPCGADDKYAPHAAVMFRSLQRVSPKGVGEAEAAGLPTRACPRYAAPACY
jgi:hypothetical protein